MSKQIVVKSLGSQKPAIINYGRASSPFGDIVLGFLSDKNNTICHLHFANESSNHYEAALQRRWPNAALVENTKTAQKLAQVIFGDTAQVIEVAMCGTPFQETVWRELVKIPAGSTRTYAEVAVAVGNPRAARAVGTAVGSNEVSVLIPCHRVVSKDGALKYRWGSEIKRKLLAFESGKEIIAQ